MARSIIFIGFIEATNLQPTKSATSGGVRCGMKRTALQWPLPDDAALRIVARGAEEEDRFTA
jgi:hypothetical protein